MQRRSFRASANRTQTGIRGSGPRPPRARSAPREHASRPRRRYTPPPKPSSSAARTRRSPSARGPLQPRRRSLPVTRHVRPARLPLARSAERAMSPVRVGAASRLAGDRAWNGVPRGTRTAGASAPRPRGRCVLRQVDDAHNNPRGQAVTTEPLCTQNNGVPAGAGLHHAAGWASLPSGVSWSTIPRRVRRSSKKRSGTASVAVLRPAQHVECGTDAARSRPPTAPGPVPSCPDPHSQETDGTRGRAPDAVPPPRAPLQRASEPPSPVSIDRARCRGKSAVSLVAAAALRRRAQPTRGEREVRPCSRSRPESTTTAGSARNAAAARPDRLLPSTRHTAPPANPVCERPQRRRR
jgi:hypothetical protein